MPLTPGTRLGPYEVTTLIGAGGMGEVYRGRDTRLDRTVAIKILPESLAGDPQFRERFDREARAISQLDHPHICALHDVGEHQGMAYLVMQYLEGETLAERLAKGALPLDQALRTAVEIGGALDKAHRSGIVHRDLKPANVMLTRSGAKLLDFGLAKALGPANDLRRGYGGQEAGPDERNAGDNDPNVRGARPQPDLTMLPTTPANLTMQGTLLGTFRYMAPEQLEGRDADARTDIFAFGALLYEMVTGRKAFEAKSQASLISAIMSSAPAPVSAVQPLAPSALDQIVRTCLAKDPDERWQSAGDLQRELKRVAESIAQTASATEPAPRRPAAGRRPMTAGVIIAAVVLTAAVTAIVAWTLSRASVTQVSRVVRLTMMLPEGEQLVDIEGPAVAIAPAGSHVAYVASSGGRRQLHLRAIDSMETRALAGTELASNPFFSPDGQWIGFFAQGKLKKVSIAAGITHTLCDAPFGVGGSWAPDDTIYFSPVNNVGLSKVSAGGGTPTAVTTLDRAKGEVSHRWPHVLPGGRTLMFTMWTGPGRDEQHVQVLRLDTGERTEVVKGGGTGRYAQSGHVVYARDDELFAVPFDLDRLQVSGQAVRLADPVRTGGEGAGYAVSDVGELVYVPGNAQRYERRLVWVSRDGRVEPLVTAHRDYYGNAVISPDGRFAAVDVEGGTIDLWIYDFSRATQTPLTTVTGSSQAPRWSADGKRIVYRGTRTGFRNLWWKVVDEATSEERLTTSENIHTPGSWSANGTWLVYTASHPATGSDLWALPAGGDRKPQVIVSSSFTESSPRLSSDGRWLAYTSDEPGRVEVFVQPFPGPGRRVQISSDGGTEPVWSRDGRELFYLNGDRMMAVEITTTPAFKAGTPRLLFEGRYRSGPNGVAAYDVSSDGRRFLRVQPMHPDPPSNQIHVVLNWQEELKRLVPGS